MLVSIHQPNFLPHLGYFEKINESDVFVFLDHVKLSKGSYTQKVSIPNGFINIPCIQVKDQAINEAKIFNQTKSYRKIERTLKQKYKKAYEIIEPAINQKYEYLSDFNIACIELFLDHFDINTKLIRSSDMDLNGSKNELLIEIIKKINGTKYLTNISNYLSFELFQKHNIEIKEFNSMKNSNGHSIITQL